MKDNALFPSLLLILCLGLLSFKEVSFNRPNGWYYVIDAKKDSLSVDPIVTTKDFAWLKLDSASHSDNKGSVKYQIMGQMTEAGKKAWADATERSVGKQLGFLFDGVVLTAPYVNCKIESGRFQIITDEEKDIKAIYKQMLQESGCKEEFGMVDESFNASSVVSLIMKSGLIALILLIVCFGVLKVRKIKKGV